MMTGNVAGAGFVAESTDSDTPVPAQRPRLLDEVRSALRVRHYSRRTERAYIGWIRRFILFHGKRHPREIVTRFLSALATDANVSASTQNPGAGCLVVPLW
jgi:hypothetical protein